MIIDMDLQDLSKLTPASWPSGCGTTSTPSGGLVGESDLEIAREAVRRARRAEQAEDALRKERGQRRSA